MVCQKFTPYQREGFVLGSLQLHQILWYCPSGDINHRKILPKIGYKCDMKVIWKLRIHLYFWLPTGTKYWNVTIFHTFFYLSGDWKPQKITFIFTFVIFNFANKPSTYTTHLHDDMGTTNCTGTYCKLHTIQHGHHLHLWICSFSADLVTHLHFFKQIHLANPSMT
jgi:hypothetical protein